jgi:hypothetical protein
MKKLLLPLLAILFLISCEKEGATDLLTEQSTYEDGAANMRSSNKRNVCHNGNIININVNAIAAHQAHGDAVDMDEDGFFDIENDCGESIDCDDNNAFIYPGAVENCENNIDDDCDGDIDETDEDCITPCLNKYVRDEFNEVSFNNNDGPDEWNGAWIENDPEVGGGGPSAGQVQVVNGELRIDDQPNTGGEPSISRKVNLSGAISATFSFDFNTAAGVDTDDAISVEASSNDGASWTVLETITNISGISTDSRSFDISAFISPNTTIRFRVSNLYSDLNEYFFVDNVQIISSCN